MDRVPRFIISVSGTEHTETASTYCEAWCRAQELYRPGLCVTCIDTEARHRLEEERQAAERAEGLRNPDLQ